MTTVAVPLALDDPINAAILTVSEDKLEGFQRDPFGEIAARSGVPVETVMERIRAL
ncbi:MAG: Lrp/AsnC family transcriptional regulator, partial [Chloroflexi bacterium]